MLTRRAPLVALVAVLIGIGTTGCFASPPTPSPSGTAAAPSASPLFASDEEALAAATEAYAAYLEVADAVATDGGDDIERLEPFVTSPYLEEQIASYSALASEGLRTSGQTKIASLTLQEVNSQSREITIYVCADVSTVRVIDGAGVDVTPPARANKYPIVVTLARADDSMMLLMDASESWTGQDFCAS